jgi:hypothetical protein
VNSHGEFRNRYSSLHISECSLFSEWPHSHLCPGADDQPDGVLFSSHRLLSLSPRILALSHSSTRTKIFINHPIEDYRSSSRLNPLTYTHIPNPQTHKSTIAIMLFQTINLVSTLLALITSGCTALKPIDVTQALAERNATIPNMVQFSGGMS